MNVLRPRRAFPLILGVGMGIGLGLGGLSLSTVAWAQAPAARPGAPVPPLRLAGPQGLGLLPGNHLGPAGPGILRIVSMQGEVLLDKGGHGSATTEPLTATAVLAAHDELSTHNGSVELAGPAGINLRLSGDALMALLAPNAFYLARGELEVMSQNALPPGPGPGQNQTTISVATSCGRTAVRAK